MLSKISIIVPVFNREKLVGETIESILAQSYPNWECIMVDDGSTDNSFAVLQEYALKDERINIYARPESKKKGANSCRNLGIEKSSGDYIIFLDSDDLLAPWCLESRISYTKEFKEIDVLVFRVLAFYPNRFYEIQQASAKEMMLPDFIEYKQLFSIPTGLWKSKVFKSVTFDENLPCWQDVDIHLRAMLQYKFKAIKDNLLDVFIRKGQTFTRISNTPSTDSAQVLFSYAYPKFLNILDGATLKLFIRAREKEIAHIIESSPRELTFGFLKVGLNSQLFSRRFKRSLRLYTRLYILFKDYGIPNIPYRIRGLFGIPRDENPTENNVDFEVNRVIFQLKEFNSELSKYIY